MTPPAQPPAPSPEQEKRIEEIVDKHNLIPEGVRGRETCSKSIKAALTELAADFAKERAELESKLAMAEDAANKGDEARTTMGAMTDALADMEEKVRELEKEREGWKMFGSDEAQSWKDWGQNWANVAAQHHTENLALAAALKQAREAVWPVLDRIMHGRIVSDQQLTALKELNLTLSTHPDSALLWRVVEVLNEAKIRLEWYLKNQTIGGDKHVHERITQLLADLGGQHSARDKTPFVSCAHGIADTHECPICDSPREDLGGQQP